MLHADDRGGKRGERILFSCFFHCCKEGLSIRCEELLRNTAQYTVPVKERGEVFRRERLLRSAKVAGMGRF